LQRNPSSFAWPLAFAAAVLVLGGGWYRESRDRAREQASIDLRLSRLEQAPQATDAPSRDGRVLPSALRAASSTRASIAGQPPSGGPRMPSPDERRRGQLQAVTRLESRFSTDGFDPQWAASTERAVAQAAAEPILAPFHGPTASEMRCARTICRLLFTFDSLDQAEDWSTYYPLGVAKGLPVFQSLSTTLPDGRVQLRMYGFRDPGAAGALR
jgi:hypothetical protein